MAKDAKPATEKIPEEEETAKPKKPASSYFLYLGANRHKIVKRLEREAEEEGTEKPDKKVISQTIAAAWKDLEPEKKKKYDDEAKALKKIYDQALERYKKTDEYVEEMEEKKKRKAGDKQSKAGTKRSKRETAEDNPSTCGTGQLVMILEDSNRAHVQKQQPILLELRKRRVEFEEQATAAAAAAVAEVENEMRPGFPIWLEKHSSAIKVDLEADSGADPTAKTIRIEGRTRWDELPQENKYFHFSRE